MRELRVIKVLLCAVLLISLSAPAACYAIDVYGSTTANSYVSYLADCMKNSAEHYVIWRSGENEYKLAHGADLSYSSAGFSGSVGITTLSYVSGYGASYNSYYTISFSEDSSFTLFNPRAYLIYSDLGGYPNIAGGVKSYEVQTVVVALVIPFVFALVALILSAWRRR